MDTDHCLATWQNVFINIWQGHTTLEAVKGIESGVVELLRRYPEGVGLIGIAHPDANTIPEQQERQALSEVLKRHGDRVHCIGSVVLGTGFFAATKRMALATISMVARQPCPLKMFSSVEDAAPWVCERMPNLGATQVTSLIHAVRTAEHKYEMFLKHPITISD